MSTEIAKLFARIGADTTGLAGGLKASEGMMMATATKMNAIGKGLTMGLTLPIIAVGGVALKMASDFDQSMRNVNSVLLLSEDEFLSMKESVLDFSLTTRSSANEVAESLLVVSQMGFRGAEALELMEYAAHSAGAAFTTADDMARLLGGAINSYGTDVSEAARLNDLFIYTMQQGGGTVTDLANTLPRVFATAATAGVGIDELTASMAWLGKRGLATEESSIAMNQAFVSLLKPSESLAAALKNAGYESGIAAVEGVGFAGVMKIVEEATGGSADQIAEMFPNIRAMRAVLNMATGDADEFATSIEGFGSASAGAMEAARIEQYKSLESNLKRLKNVFGVLAVAIGTQLIPPLVELITKWIGPLRDWVLGISPEMLQLGIKIALVAAAVGPLLMVGSKLIKFFMLLSSPIGLVVAAIGLLVYAFATDFMGIRTTIVGVVRDIVAYFTEFADVFRLTGESIRNFVLMVVGQFMSFGPQIGAIFGQAFARIGDIVNLVLPLIVDTFLNMFGGLMVWWDTFWPPFATTISEILESISIIINTALAAIFAWWQLHGQQVMDVVTNLWNALLNIVGTVFTIIGGLINAILKAIRGDWAGAWETIKTTFSTAWESIKKAAGFVWGALKAAFGNMLDSLRLKVVAFGSKIYNAGRDLMNGLLNGIKSKITAIIDAVRNAVGDAIAAAKRLLGIASDSKVFTQIGQFTMGGLAEGLERGASGAKNAMQSAVSQVVGGAGSPMALSGMGGGGGNINIGQLIVSAPTDNPEKLANDVMRLIAWKASMRNALPTYSPE